MLRSNPRFSGSETAVLLLTLAVLCGCKTRVPDFGADLDPPVVIGTEPSDDEVGVSFGSVVRVILSEPIDATSVDGLTLSVQTDGLPVAGSVSTTGDSIVFVPLQPLEYLREFEVKFDGSAVRDLAGNLAEEDLTWRFHSRDYGWDPPTVLSANSSGDAQAGGIAVDDQGNSVAVWSEYDGIRSSIWAARFDVDAGWALPVAIETDTGGSASLPRVALDGAGDGLVVWIQRLPDRSDVWARELSNQGTWGNAGVIASFDTSGFPGVAPATSAPALVMNSAGRGSFAWHKSDGARDNVHAARYVKGSGWSEEQLVEGNADGHARWPLVAIGATGFPVAIWTQDGTSGGALRGNQYDPGIEWGIPTSQGNLIGPSGTGALNRWMFSDSSGDVFALWAAGPGAAGGAIQAARFDGTWSAAEDISDGADGMVPKGAAWPDGDATAVWQQFGLDGSSVWRNAFTSGVGWSAPVLVQGQDVDARSPSIIADARGHGLIVWRQGEAPSSIWWIRYGDDRTWSGPLQLAGDGFSQWSPVQLSNHGSGRGSLIGTVADGVTVRVWASNFR